jgi:dihydrofolate synthase/folylpolyglutamate synthase
MSLFVFSVTPRTLDQWLSRIGGLHPRSIDPGLDRVRPVAEALGVLELPCPVVTIGGTNGKGSSVALLESMFAAGGYRVAAYTSPHLLRYNERMRIDGIEAGDEALCEAFERVEGARAGISLSYFEFGTLVALDLFRRAAPDLALLEVGMGGRLDAVNIVEPSVALITTIGLDHTEWLGPDREAIGREKAGIFRRGKPAVCGEAVPPESLLAAARELGAPLYLRERDFAFTTAGESGWSWRGPGGAVRENLPPLGLSGGFQLANAANALMVTELLADVLPLDPQPVRQGLAGARVAGRCQHVPGRVPGLIDVAHNVDSAQVLATVLAAEACEGRTLAVFGALDDKDLPGMVAAMSGQVSRWYVAAPEAERAASAERIAAAVLAGAGMAADVFPSLADAWRKAQGDAAPGDRVVAFGSFYTAAEILSLTGSDEPI